MARAKPGGLVFGQFGWHQRNATKMQSLAPGSAILEAEIPGAPCEFGLSFSSSELGNSNDRLAATRPMTCAGLSYRCKRGNERSMRASLMLGRLLCRRLGLYLSSRCRRLGRPDVGRPFPPLSFRRLIRLATVALQVQSTNCR